MATYRIHFADDGIGEAKVLEFDGEDPHDAFVLLKHETGRRRATVWEGEKKLGTLERTSDDLWVVR